MSLLRKLLLAILFAFPTAAHAAVPYIFATQPAGNVPASYLDSDFAYVLTPPYTPPGTGALATTINSYLNLGYLHSLAYATGNGTTDDTAALQAWVNACLSTGLTCYMDPAPGTAYLISSEISDTSANPLTIIGPGFVQGARILLGSPTQNGLYFDTTGRLNLSGFGVYSASASASAGAGVYIDGSANQTVGITMDNLVLGFSGAGGYPLYNGLYSVGGADYQLTRSSFAPLNYGAYISNIGDSYVTGNTFSPQATGGIGMYLTGDPGGARVVSNKWNSGVAYATAIAVDYSIGDGDVFFIANSIESYNEFGILLQQGANAITFGNVIVSDNEFSAGATSTARAIEAPNVSVSGGLLSLIINGNVMGGAQHGILIGSTEYANIYGNQCNDIDINSTVTTGTVNNNTIFSAGQINNASTSVIVVNNPGFNPVGASTISFLTSPNTYTAGGSPETLYLSDSSGITALTDNGTSILPHATGANVVLTLDLGPFETAVITSSGTLTGKKMIH